MNTNPKNPSDESESNIQSGITRRTFIKRTSATAAATVLALHAFRYESLAVNALSYPGRVLVSKTYYIAPAFQNGATPPYVETQYPPATYPSFSGIVAPVTSAHNPNPVEHFEWGYAHTDVKPGEQPYPRVNGATETVVPANPKAVPPVIAHSDWKLGPVVTITFCYVTQKP